MDIHLQFELTPEDILDLQRYHRRLIARANRPRRLLARIGFIAVFLVFVVATADMHMTISYFSVAPWVIIVLMLPLIYRTPGATRRAFKKYPRLAVPHDLHALSETLTLQLPHCATVMHWPYFALAVETASSFLLFSARGSAIILPKRAFTSTADIDLFRGFARAHIGDKPIGFPVLPLSS